MRADAFENYVGRMDCIACRGKREGCWSEFVVNIGDVATRCAQEVGMVMLRVVPAGTVATSDFDAADDTRGRQESECVVDCRT